MLALFASVAYAAALVLQLSRLFKKWRLDCRWVWGVALLAVVLHAVVLYRWIDINGQQNLAFWNVISLVAWLNVALITLMMAKESTENLLLFAVPLALLSLLMGALFPQQYWVNTGAHPAQLVHILLAVLTFSVLCVAALQAGLLALQEQLLRQKRLAGISRMLPAVNTMEALLFQWNCIGFILLSIVLVNGFWAFDNLFSPALLQKTLLALLAWLVFAVLISGRLFFGWRGLRASYYTIIGVALLALSYFGSRWLVEILG